MTGMASDGMTWPGLVAPAVNWQKLFIGQLWSGIDKSDLEAIMRAMGCAASHVHLVPGLSLFRRMSCLFCSFCFPLCLLV